MLELKDAVKLFEEGLGTQTRTEYVSLNEAYGRVTVHDVRAPFDVPAFSRSAMDGFAVCAGEKKELLGPLRQVGSLVAGDDAAGLTVGTGTCVRIMTGAPLPEGANAVVRLEDTTPHEDSRIEPTVAVASGENRIKRGADLMQDDVVISAHTRLDSDRLAALATLGLTKICVFKPIRVGLIATGDELVCPGEPLRPGTIYNSTVYTLASYVRRYSGRVVFQELCPDKPQAFVDLMVHYAGKVDVVLTTGGVSVGDRDFIPEAIELLGARELFHRIQIKPGTPVMGSSWNHTMILSMSGNPHAAFANFHLFYWHMLSRFFECEAFRLKRLYGTHLAYDYTKLSQMPRFIRATVHHGIVELPSKDHHFSHGAYNCLVVQPTMTVLTTQDELELYILPD